MEGPNDPPDFWRLHLGRGGGDRSTLGANSVGVCGKCARIECLGRGELVWRRAAVGLRSSSNRPDPIWARPLRRA